MKLSFVDLLGDGERHEVAATVTTNHPASSYGQPVIVLESDGEALDITSWILLNYQIVAATPEEVELLKRVLIIDPHVTASYLGSKGGKSRSDAKRKASAENGKKGGRPKKTTA
jgi:hypothetical protein